MQVGEAPQGYEPGNILVTGAAGFIGSHVAAHLVYHHPGSTVVGLDKLDYCASTNNLREAALFRNFVLVRGDQASSDLLMHVLRAHAIDTVINLAAQTHVDASFENAVSFTQDNVLATHVLLEAVRTTGTVRRFLHVSTDQVYGPTPPEEEHGHSKAARLQPLNPYAASKAGAEMLVMAYGTAYHLPVLIVRSSNVFGPRQFPEKLIPKFLMRALAGQSLPIHGRASEYARSFLYVEDAVAALTTVLAHGEPREVYNCAGTERTVAEVAQDVRTLVRIASGLSTAVDIQMVENRPFDDGSYRIDDRKLRQLGWRPRVSWWDGLRSSLAWYRDHGGQHWGNIAHVLRASHETEPPALQPPASSVGQ